MILNNPDIEGIGSLSISSSKSGYNTVPFSGKNAQIEEVADSIDKLGLIPEPIIEEEAKWFYESLGIDDVFFERETVDGIVSHIHALYSAKLDAVARNDLDSPLISYKIESDDHAVYFDTSIINSDQYKLTNFEERIDEIYLDKLDSSYRIESFTAPLVLNNHQFKLKKFKNQDIRIHFVYKNKFSNGSIYDETYLKIISDNTKKIYDEIINETLNQSGPIIKHFQIDDKEHRIIIGYKKNSTNKFFNALTTLINYYKLDQSRKYVENFANGVTIISFYLKQSFDDQSNHINQLIREISLLYTIPSGIFHSAFANKEFSLQESIYAHIGTIFVTHFLNRLGNEYQTLTNILKTNDSVQVAELLSNLKKRLRSETFTQSFIFDVFNRYKSIVSQLFRSFADVHYVKSKVEKTLSYQRLTEIKPISNEAEFNDLLIKNCFNENDALILKFLFVFNKSILKTNFFLPSKVAISFRLNADFLPKFEYPETPFGLFFIVGSDFRGFHIRFRDIARGGIRIVQSRSLDAYEINVRNLFDENYNLASTQQRKNKDIPEGGSKGVILLDLNAQKNPKSCFEKYIDSLIDLLLIKSKPIVDLYGKEEILFLGPDEGTANFTDWATLHAKKRGAPWWKSFLTGKSPKLGGIPHDEYGMTSLSVRSYVEKIYEKFNLLGSDKKIVKFQTGGPDGDLGSNEILLSTPNEEYISIVDGSGVIFDSEGINKTELIRLAKERKTINNFNKELLSPSGFVVLVDDKNIKLPNKEVINNGVYFRNNFHLNIFNYLPKNDDGEIVKKIDLFVPCGGRPAAIDINNVKNLIDSKTNTSKISYIVEGANLFITQDAKIKLEKSGCVLFKDASANKGGVTSSSFEVLASLVLNDEQFLKIFQKGESFYDNYVKQVQSKIILNAKNEAQVLFNLQDKNNSTLTLSELSDFLSVEINKLADLISKSDDLWNDLKLRHEILKLAIPSLLLEQVSIDEIIEKLPVNYLRSLFATTISTTFIYKGGDPLNLIDLLTFMKDITK